jgi:hypothetical protein
MAHVNQSKSFRPRNDTRVPALRETMTPPVSDRSQELLQKRRWCFDRLCTFIACLCVCEMWYKRDQYPQLTKVRNIIST